MLSNLVEKLIRFEFSERFKYVKKVGFWKNFMHGSINLREQDALFVTLFCLMFRLTTNEIGLILKFHFHRQYNKQLPELLENASYEICSEDFRNCWVC